MALGVGGRGLGQAALKAPAGIFPSSVTSQAGKGIADGLIKGALKHATNPPKILTPRGEVIASTAGIGATEFIRETVDKETGEAHNMLGRLGAAGGTALQKRKARSSPGGRGTARPPKPGGTPWP